MVKWCFLIFLEFLAWVFFIVSRGFLEILKNLSIVASLRYVLLECLIWAYDFVTWVAKQFQLYFGEFEYNGVHVGLPF